MRDYLNLGFLNITAIKYSMWRCKKDSSGLVYRSVVAVVHPVMNTEFL
jgi:hypothetical protein